MDSKGQNLWAQVTPNTAVQAKPKGLYLRGESIDQDAVIFAIMHARQVWGGRCYVNPALPKEIKLLAWEIAQQYGVELNFKPSHRYLRERAAAQPQQDPAQGVSSAPEPMLVTGSAGDSEAISDQAEPPAQPGFFRRAFNSLRRMDRYANLSRRQDPSINMPPRPQAPPANSAPSLAVA